MGKITGIESPSHQTPVPEDVSLNYQTLEQRVEARTRELSTLLKVSHAVASTLEMEPLLGLILDQLKDVISYDGASVFGLEEETLTILAYRGPASKEEISQLRFPLASTSVNRQVVSLRQPVIIPDTRGDSPIARAFQESAGKRLDTTFAYIRSWLGVPLIVKERVIGMLTLDHNEPNYYSPHLADLAMAFANQVAVALENARLYMETRRRADEIQTLFNVQQAIASPLAWDLVLQLIADEARRLTSTRLSAVFLLEGSDLCLSMISGSENLTGLSVGYRLPMDQSVAGLAIRSGQTILVEDVQSDPRVNLEIRQNTEVKSLLVAPLLVKGTQPIGAILVADKSSGRLAPDDERVLTMLASGAVIQLENARLFAQAEQRMKELEALYRADQEFYRHLHLDELLQVLVDAAVDVLHADKGVLMVWDNRRERLVVGASRGFSLETLDKMSFAPGESLIADVATSGEVAIVEDTHADSRIASHITRPEGIRSLMHVPIEIGGQIFGVFNVDYVEPHAFSDVDRRLFTALAQRAALAIENAQLYEQAKKAATLGERQRLARELHDAVTQTLFSASLIAEVLPRLWERNEDEGKRRLEELRQLARGALAEMRTLLLELRPAALVEAELDSLLHQLAEATTGRTRVPVNVTIEVECPLSSDVRIALYRIAQEALNNVAKHSGASHAEVRLGHKSRGELELRISDDGRGFDASKVSTDHLGLGIMRERAEAIGATLSIESQLGRGTQVMVTWVGSS